ncbi:hypothetical protein [Listeria costaricensis]|uniref:hypothetical protein n=1 Tax=Listeria costaricensis TaxID=2026604 RepID=UPI000C074F0E|nr:hypothetical protein [Listeria costaricensis]
MHGKVIKLEGMEVDLTKPIINLEIADHFLCEMMERPEVAEFFCELDIHEEMTAEEVLDQANYIREKYLQATK